MRYCKGCKERILEGDSCPDCKLCVECCKCNYVLPFKRTRPSVAIYHSVRKEEGFEKTALILFQLVHNARLQFPHKQRVLYLDIENHKNEEGGFDEEMFYLQKDFILGYLLQFLSEIHCPLINTKNIHPQSNDLPHILRFVPGGRKFKEKKKNGRKT